MSTKLSLRAALAQQVSSRERSQKPSAFPVHNFLLEAVDIKEPVKLAKALISLGLSLKRAHAVVNRLASGERVAVELPSGNIAVTISQLRRFGLVVFALKLEAIDPKRIRENQNLSQSEFAALYGLDLSTLQNWEQHRNEPDTPAKLLLAIIEKNPRLAVNALYGAGLDAGSKQYN
jgi:DNA-binding XRE family transcriptional regulator